MKIIESGMQKGILKFLGVERMNKSETAQRLNLSQPTVRKVMDGETPIIVSNKVYYTFESLIDGENECGGKS